MIEKPGMGIVYRYVPPTGTGCLVKVIGFRKGFVETTALKDGRHRSISRKRLELA
jgi:hypothetical protein